MLQEISIEKSDVVDGLEPELDLAEALFSPEAAWEAVCIKTPICEQLRVEVAGPDDLRLVWKVPTGNRPVSSQPTRIELQIPEEILKSQTAWEFRADMLTNLARSEASSTSEPMRTPFFSTLMDKGFAVVSVENASLTDAALQMRFAKDASLSNVRLQAEGCIRCDRLTLSQVEITDAKLSIYTESGWWRGVVFTGTTELLGAIGKTVMDEKCKFDRSVVKADCREADFGPDLSNRLIGGVYDGSLMPPSVQALLGPVNEEYVRKMYGALEALKHEAIRGEWADSVDRTSNGQRDGSASIPSGGLSTARPG